MFRFAIIIILRPANYSLHAHAQREATYSHEDEGKARGWLEAVSGEPIEGFFETLKDGSYLCRCIQCDCMSRAS